MVEIKRDGEIFSQMVQLKRISIKIRVNFLMIEIFLIFINDNQI